MLRNAIAGVLLILSALPFTAPFATVDMPTLLGTPASGAQDEATVAPSVEDGSHALVASAARIRTRTRSVLRLAIDVTSPHAAAHPLDRPIPAAAASNVPLHHTPPASLRI